MAVAVTAAVSSIVFLMRDNAPVDERVVLGILVWGAVAFALAIITKMLRLGLLSQIAERVTFVSIPPLALIFLVLGTKFLGETTPTHGGAMCAVAAIIMTVMRKRLRVSLLLQAIVPTSPLSIFVVFFLTFSQGF